MEAKLNFKNVERRIKELAKEYESKGYHVSINPSQSDLPDFLQGSEPDLIAKNNEESVIIEVKSRKNINDLKRYERFAKEISERKNWRFELVFTNTQTPYIEKSTNNLLDKDKIKQRLFDIERLINGHFLDAAYLLIWSTLEAAMRLQLKNEKIEDLDQSTSYIFKSVFAYGLINQQDYKTLEKLYPMRNNIAHGFSHIINEKDIYQLINITNYLIGEGIEFEMQVWLENLDLDYYDDIYSLYQTVNEKESYGAFNYEEIQGSIIISADYVDEKLILESDEHRKQLANLIEDEYMGGMDPEGWYGYNRAMEKDD